MHNNGEYSHTFKYTMWYTLYILVSSWKEVTFMLEEFYPQVGNFLAPVIQGIMIYVISHILIEIFKNRK